MPEVKNIIAADGQCLFEAETLALQSLIAGANPNPQDDLAENSPVEKPRMLYYTTGLIYQLIDCIKSI
jgi:hypothetical protein